MTKAPQKVVLLVGGWSAERDVSLEKGKHVEAALRAEGFDLTVIDVQKDLEKFTAQIKQANPDVVFNNLYGTGGEDGVIQSVLEMMGVPYTHSGPCASAICMNKELTRKIAQTVGIKTAKGGVFTYGEVVRGETGVPAPYVLKPVAEGSSVSVYIVKEGDNRTFSDWSENDDVLVEEYIPGKELTVAILDGKAQAVTEIVAQTEFFDYEAKYKAQDTQYILPAPVAEDVYKKAMAQAESVYKAIGCSGLARCDFRFDDTKGADGLCLLEINNQPGLTAESIGPSQVVYNGKDFGALCRHLVETAKLHSADANSSLSTGAECANPNKMTA
jgi:D-alanine-D-alanine ligase